MLSVSRKHRVLSTHSLSAGALERLSFFFDVQVAPQRCTASPPRTLELLQDVAGVITDQHTLHFKKDVVEQLPHLRAICLLDAQPDNLDLDTLTQAGIRATGLPAGVDNTVEEVWTSLTLTLQNHVRPAARAGGGSNQTMKRFSGSLFSSSLLDVPLGFLGASPLARALHARALQAQACPSLVDLHCLTPENAPIHWLIIPPDWSAAAGRSLDASSLQALPSSAGIIDFCATPSIPPAVALLPAWQGRIIHTPVDVSLAPQTVDPSSTVAEQLIAALGFGRKSFHPDNLLNPDVCCESCC